MPTATFAVQPSTFASFDEWGCEWATDLNHAVRMAKAFAASEHTAQVIWKVANNAPGAVAWMEVAA
jgi:hypothetical protein